MMRMYRSVAWGRIVPRYLSPVPAEQRERLAVRIEAGRADILAAYEENLKTSGNPVSGDPLSLRQAVDNGGEILSDMVESVRASRITVDAHYKLLAWTIGEARAAVALNPSESLRAAVVFYETVVTDLSRHVADAPELLFAFVLAVLALNESINLRIREATVAYTGYLLEQVHQEHIGERRRYARELHDRLGEGLSTTLRQLELHELAGADDPVRASVHAATALEMVTESMRRLRALITDLRQEPVANLEKALAGYLDKVEGEGVRLWLRVSGDEGWASRTVLDESFLIIREAIRNALTHAKPTMVLVRVDVAPRELHAWVEDDGDGFDEARGAESSGLGLTSMRERARLLGGRVTVSSRSGRGTHVELTVPLLRARDDLPG